MKTRMAYILKGQVIADNGIWAQNVPTKEAISAIMVNIMVTNGATSNTAIRPEDALTKLEIVDGSKVIFSAPGWLAKAMSYWHEGNDSSSFYDQGPGAVQTSSILIPFGHFIGDEQYYLDPAKWANLQVRITNSMTVSATVGWATGTFTADVIAILFTDAPPAAKGFLMFKDIYDFTTAASGDAVIQMPIDYPYRAIIARTFLTATDFETGVTNAKLTCDMDSFIPYDLSIAAIRKMNEELFRPFRQKAVGFGANAYAMKYPCGKLTHADCVPYTTLTYGGMASVVNDTGTITTVTVTVAPAIAAGAAMRFGTEYGGFYPYFSFLLPFGGMVAPDQYVDPKAYKDIRLRLTQGAASFVSNIGLWQVAQPW
jgi:hypothetical protein